MTRKPTAFIPKPIPQCCGKNRYGTQAEAEQVAEEQMLIFRSLRLETYRCTCGCHGWHLTRKKLSPYT